jgi:hypothetical protein
MNSKQEAEDYHTWTILMSTLDSNEKKRFEAYVDAIQIEFSKISKQRFGRMAAIHVILRTIYFLEEIEKK